jgi:hypothetical protein
MVFSQSPALHRIRQLVRLIRKHPDLPERPRNAARHALKLPDMRLPDPELFVDSSTGCNGDSGRADHKTHRTRANSPGQPER